MKANGKPLTFLCNEQLLEIPFFQRAYVWDVDNWRELLEDLISTKGNHFLGSIILKRCETSSGTAKKQIIIDGQQRLTTLSILVKALYDCIQKKNSRLLSDAREALFFTLRSSDSNYQLTIRHSYNDHKQYEEVIGTVEDEVIQSPILNKLDEIDEKSKIKSCYKFFYEELKKKDQNEIIDLWDSLFNEDNNILVVIDLNDNDQEQKIFDTINSSGIRLTATDIIKNALYQHLIDKNGDPEQVAEYYKATWEKTFEDEPETIDYWTKEKTVGRFKRQNSELLLQAIAVIKIMKTDDKDFTFDKLSKYFKEYINELTEAQTKLFISEIIEYAQIYREHILDFNGKETFEYNNNDLREVEKRVSLILDKTDISTFNPYIIYLFKEFSNDEKKTIEYLIDLEKFVMLHLITKTTTKSFNKNCREFIKDKTGKSIKTKIKSFKEQDIRTGLSYKVSNKLGNIILFWVELHRRLDPKYNTSSLQYSYQLEHIMPQKWKENWSKVDYVDENGNILPNNENSETKRTNKVYSIGNMTLLSGRLNISVSNSDFKTKMEGDTTKKGVIKYSSLSVTKDDLVENIYRKNRIWNEQTISEREKYIIDEVIDIWGNS